MATIQRAVQQVDLAGPSTFDGDPDHLRTTGPQTERPDRILSDRRFVDRCERLSRIRMLLLLQGIIPQDIGDWAHLEAAKYRRTGRPASTHEWQALVSAEDHIATFVTPEIRLHIRTASVRGTVRFWSIASLVVGMAAFTGALFVFAHFEACIPDKSCTKPIAEISLPAIGRLTIALCYMFFTLALGAMGSAASIALNSLSTKTDDKFDLTDKDLVIMRIVAGSLFALALSIPWSGPVFGPLAREIALLDQWPMLQDPKQTAYIIFPFMIGFSTALVLLVINRFVSGLEAIFGFQRTIDKGRSNE